MSFVFVSHANADKPRIRHIVDALIGDGHKVWIDNPAAMGYGEQDIQSHFARLHADRRWQDEIDEAIREAGAVLVCFSRRFGEQRDMWHDEAAGARILRKLVACRIDDVDPQTLRNNFSLQQVPDLDSSRPPADLKTALALLLDDIRRKLAASATEDSDCRLSGTVRLHTSPSPDAWDNRFTPEQYEYARRVGNLCLYDSAMQGDVVRIFPKFRYAEEQANNVPIYPIWIEHCHFSAPALDFLFLNTCSTAKLVTSIKFRVHEGYVDRQPWIIPDQPNYHREHNKLTSQLAFTENGWSLFDLADIEYDTVDTPDDLPAWNRDPLQWGDNSDLRPDDMLALEGPYWDNRHPHRQTGTVSEHSASFDIPVSHFSRTLNNKFCLIFGWLALYYRGKQTMRRKFISRAIFCPVSYSGVLNPSNIYNIEIPAEGEKASFEIPVAHHVPPNGADHIIVAIYTEKSAYIDFSASFVEIGGKETHLGRILMTTLFPYWYGLFGYPKKSNAIASIVRGSGVP